MTSHRPSWPAGIGWSATAGVATVSAIASWDTIAATHGMRTAVALVVLVYSVLLFWALVVYVRPGKPRIVVKVVAASLVLCSALMLTIELATQTSTSGTQTMA